MANKELLALFSGSNNELLPVVFSDGQCLDSTALLAFSKLLSVCCLLLNWICIRASISSAWAGLKHSSSISSDGKLRGKIEDNYCNSPGHAV